MSLYVTENVPIKKTLSVMEKITLRGMCSHVRFTLSFMK